MSPLQMSGGPRYSGSCRCGLSRGHTGLCNGEVPTPTKTVRQKMLSGTPWHDMRDNLEEKFGHHMGTWLAKRMATHLRGKDCISNFSIAEKPAGARMLLPSLWKDLALHDETRSGGCCGSFDTELHHYESGRKFAFGFNFGH